MKKYTFTFFAAFFFLAGIANSQAPLAAPTSILGQLQTIQASNKALIGQQQKTLETIEQLKAAAEQMKTFGKRS